MKKMIIIVLSLVCKIGAMEQDAQLVQQDMTSKTETIENILHPMSFVERCHAVRQARSLKCYTCGYKGCTYKSNSLSRYTCHRRDEGHFDKVTLKATKTEKLIDKVFRGSNFTNNQSLVIQYSKQKKMKATETAPQRVKRIRAKNCYNWRYEGFVKTEEEFKQVDFQGQVYLK